MTEQATTIKSIKRAARKLKRAAGITHTEALNSLARDAGFENYVHMARTAPNHVSEQKFPVTLSKSWKDRKTGAKGVEEITIQLPQPVSTLIKPHQMAGYMGGIIISNAHSLVLPKSFGAFDSQEHARQSLCRIARALQFIAATGLKPARSNRCYPKGLFENRPPIADHDHCWYDPITKCYILTTEPYPRSEYDCATWSGKFGFGIVKISRLSIYGLGTELFIAGKSEAALNLRELATRIERDYNPIDDSRWHDYDVKSK